MQFNDTAVANDEARIHGHYSVSCLTPKAETLNQFLPLWYARMAATERLAELEHRHEQLALNPPKRFAHARLTKLINFALSLFSSAQMAQVATTEYGQWAADRAFLTERILIARAVVQSFTDQMRPYQYERFHEEFDNLVTTVGKNDILDKYLKGATYTQTLVMGLCGTGTKAAADTQASHGGWSEVGGTNAPAFTGNRPAITMGTASGGVSTSPSTSFAITSSGTVAGCFMNNGGSATKDNTTGILFSAGDFSGGSQAVNNLDTLNVVYTLTAS